MSARGYMTLNGLIYVADYTDKTGTRFGVSYKAKQAEQEAFQGKTYASVTSPKWIAPMASVVPNEGIVDAVMVVGVAPFMKKFIPHSIHVEFDMYLLYSKIHKEFTLVCINKINTDIPVMFITGNTMESLVFQLVLEHDRSFMEKRYEDKHAEKRSAWIERYLVRLPHVRVEEVL